MRTLSEEHTLQAIKHVSAVRRIHKLIDGAQWDSDTTSSIAQVIEGLGYEIHAPEDVDEIWRFPADIYFTIAKGPLEEQVVTSVTVQPAMGTDLTLWNSDETVQDRGEEEAERLLSNYLSSIKIEGEDFFEADATYPLRWEG